MRGTEDEAYYQAIINLGVTIMEKIDADAKAIEDVKKSVEIYQKDLHI